MPASTITRYQVRADARDEAERLMRAHADAVRATQPDASWSVYRDRRAPTTYVAVAHAVGPDAATRQQAAQEAFRSALAPLLDGAIDERELELVTSSDLQRRFRGPTRRPRSRR